MELPRMTHCQLPCDKNWSADIDGEHVKGTYQLDGTRHCEYCTDDEECHGLEFEGKSND